MKRNVIFVLVGLIILAFIITGFVGQGKKVTEPKSSVEGRIKTLEAEIAELKAMLKKVPGSEVNVVGNDPGLPSGPRAWTEGTRCWVEDGTNMWTSIAPVPTYNVGVGMNNPVGKIESRVVLPGGATPDETCYGIKTLAKPGFQDYAYGGYFEAHSDNGTPHDYYGVYSYVHGNNITGSDIKAAVGARSEGNGSGYSYGVFAADSNSERGYGVYGAAIGRNWDAPTLSYGLYGRADGVAGLGGLWISKAYGVYATATTADSTFGIYATASGGTNNWAGYFAGNVGVTDNLDLSVGTTILDSDGDVPSSAGDVLAYDGSDYNWQPGGGSDNDWSGAGTGSMYATSLTDNVGIGTTNPQKKLHVNGDARFETIWITDTPIPTIAFGASAEHGFIQYMDFSIDIVAKAGRDIRLGTNLSYDDVVIDTDGDVGIGTTNPTERLHVIGNILCTGKLTASGGIDPPYVLYDSETRKSIKERVAKEVPEEKQDGAVLFWNGEDLRFEVYLPSKGEFRDIQGNSLARL